MIKRDSAFLEKVLNLGRKVIPRPVFEFFRPWYHGFLALSGSVLFGFPSRKLKVIGITGTKGKSTTVYLTTKFLEEAGFKVAAIGSLGYKIGEKEWPNTLKMTLPGRWKTQKFLKRAVKANCKFAVLEVTSEGIKQKRHWGIKFDTAVFTNLEKEHIESHGSFENYYKEKQKLFKNTANTHILNGDSPHVELFSQFNAKNKIFYKREDWPGFDTNLIGSFNKMNILAAAVTARNYGVDAKDIQSALDRIKSIPGRMEVMLREPTVVVDYAHTPDSLIRVYQTVGNTKFPSFSEASAGRQAPNHKQITNSPEESPADGEGNDQTSKLICVLGAAGGGRDKWKRSEFGKIAAEYCDDIILTNEDPYEEDPEKILNDIEAGFSEASATHKIPTYEKILDRRDAIGEALKKADNKDKVVITGKGAEPIMMMKDGPIEWDDREVVREESKKISNK